MEIGPRQLTQAERGILSLLLSRDVPGVEDLRSQSRDVVAVGRCDFGCPSIELARTGMSPRGRSTLTPVEGRVSGDQGPRRSNCFSSLTMGSCAIWSWSGAARAHLRLGLTSTTSSWWRSTDSRRWRWGQALAVGRSPDLAPTRSRCRRYPDPGAVRNRAHHEGPALPLPLVRLCSWCTQQRASLEREQRRCSSAL
jgi:hypothetical protein